MSKNTLDTSKISEGVLQAIANILSDQARRVPGSTLRSFSKSLGFSPALISMVLSRKRKVSAKLLKELLNQEMSHADRKVISAWLTANEAIHQLPQTNEVSQHEFDQLEAEHFEMISSPVHFAVLTLLRSKAVKFSNTEVASVLGIESFFADITINRLKRMGLVGYDKDGFLKLKTGIKTTSTNTPSAAIKSYHRSKLNSCLSALSVVPVHERDFSSISMIVDSSRLGELQADIQKMRRKIFQKYDSKNGDRVYDLNTQLLPVSNKFPKPTKGVH